VLILVVTAAFVAAGTATGDPSVNAKQAQAQQVMGQITQLDSSLHRAQSAYESATVKLRGIEHSLKINKVALHAARANLGRAQVALAQRLVAIYTTRDEQSTLSVLLGAQSIDDLVSRIETVQSVSSQDVAVMNQVISFKHQVTAYQHALVKAHVDQKRLVAQRAANRCSPTPSPGTDVIRLEAQVRAQCDVRAGVCRLGVQKSRGGTHVRASRIMRAITQDWSAERGSRNYVLSWCVPVFF